jgi:hypothetical protein
MLFSDESPFVLRFNKKIRVWRRYNERYNPECTRASVKHDKKKSRKKKRFVRTYLDTCIIII